jgi:hypothetical protein
VQLVHLKLLVADGDARIVRDHVVADRLDGLRVSLQPSDLQAKVNVIINMSEVKSFMPLKCGGFPSPLSFFFSCTNDNSTIETYLISRKQFRQRAAAAATQRNNTESSVPVENLSSLSFRLGHFNQQAAAAAAFGRAVAPAASLAAA